MLTAKLEEDLSHGMCWMNQSGAGDQGSGAVILMLWSGERRHRGPR